MKSTSLAIGHCVTSSRASTGAGSAASARATVSGSADAARQASASERRPLQQKSMPNPSSTAAARKSAATMSPIVFAVDTSFMAALPMPPSVAADARRRYDPRHMSEQLGEALRHSVLFRRLKQDDRQRLAAVAAVRAFDKG